MSYIGTNCSCCEISRPCRYARAFFIYFIRSVVVSGTIAVVMAVDPNLVLSLNKIITSIYVLFI